MSKGKTVRDPLYNYIELTPIELCIIDQPIFQRLRFILQNSTAYLTYPSNFNSRFLHSLGVMHLSGTMYVRALEHARIDTLNKYLAEAEDLIKRIAANLLIPFATFVTGWRETLGNASGFNHRPFQHVMGPQLASETETDTTTALLNPAPEQLFTINTLWQAVRVCALIHDIGHLPLSHLFEHALTQFDSDTAQTALSEDDARRLKAFKNRINDEVARELGLNSSDGGTRLAATRARHEIIGLMTIQELHPDSPNTSEREFARLVFTLANLIFVVGIEPAVALAGDDRLRPLRCLHTIVAGDLDADRLDYCVRDPQSSGLELGAIDVRRIVDSMVLHEEITDQPAPKQRFRILPNARATSAVEAFFHQRYQMYKNLVYHHNVVRMNGVVKQLIVRLLLECDEFPGEEIAAELDRFGFWTKQPSKDGHNILSGSMEQYDDAWLRTLFSMVRRKLEANDRSWQNWKKNAHASRLREILLLADTFLYRKSSNIISVWKRESDYTGAIAKVGDAAGIGLSGYDLLVVPEHGLDFDRWVLSPLTEELGQLGVVVVHEFLSPKIFSGAPGGIAVIKDDGQMEDIARVSPYLGSMRQVAATTPNLHISFVGEKIKANPQGLAARCRDKLYAHLSVYARVRFGPPDSAGNIEKASRPTNFWKSVLKVLQTLSTATAQTEDNLYASFKEEMFKISLRGATLGEFLKALEVEHYLRSTERGYLLTEKGSTEVQRLKRFLASG